MAEAAGQGPEVDVTVRGIDIPGDPDDIAQALREAVESELDRQATQERAAVDIHAKSSVHYKS